MILGVRGSDDAVAGGRDGLEGQRDVPGLPDKMVVVADDCDGDYGYGEGGEGIMTCQHDNVTLEGPWSWDNYTTVVCRDCGTKWSQRGRNFAQWFREVYEKLAAMFEKAKSVETVEAAPAADEKSETWRDRPPLL